MFGDVYTMWKADDRELPLLRRVQGRGRRIVALANEKLASVDDEPTTISGVAIRQFEVRLVELFLLLKRILIIFYIIPKGDKLH